MSGFDNFGNDMKLLSDLLNPTRNDNSSDDEEHVVKKSTNSYLSPADISASATSARNVTDQVHNKSETRGETKKSPYEKIPGKTAIDYENETFQRVDSIVDSNSWKKTPTWEISYRQNVSASDVYLQIGNKTPSTSSCESMLIKIDLPNESSQTIDLKIHNTEVELSSSQYFLKLPLPQRVNPQLGNAKFDNDTESLMVALIMDREFDFVNF